MNLILEEKEINHMMYRLRRPACFVNNRRWSQEERRSTQVLSSTNLVILASALPFLSSHFAMWKGDRIITHVKHLAYARCFTHVSPFPSRMQRHQRMKNLWSSLKKTGVNLRFKSNDLPRQVHSC